MKYNSPKQLFDAIDESKRAYETTFDVVAERAAQAGLYYEGLHWQAGSFHFREKLSTRRYLDTVYDPDRHDLRVIDNFVTPLMLRLSAQTYPAQMEVEVQPGDADATSFGASMAQACEDTINASIDLSGYLKARRAANFSRTIFGDYGVGLSLEFQTRTLNIRGRDVRMRDRVLRAFAFPPTHLILDPYETSPDLSDHETVTYRDVWSIHKLRREFGDEVTERFDPAKMKTVGELAEFEIMANHASAGRLFPQHRQFSKTKGVLVFQIHTKDETGRHGEMYVVIDGGEGQKVWMNDENPVTPFGGIGLPLGLLHANRSPESPWSKSDLWMVMDDQNRRNVLKTIAMRHLAKYSAFKVIADERWFKGNKNDALAQLTNRIGGIITGKGGDPKLGITQPQVMQFPAPSPLLDSMSEREQLAAFEKVSRPEVSVGRTKSHVPDSTFQTALEQANQVGGVRIQEDVEMDARLLTVVLGTQVDAIRNQSPTILAALRRRGMEPEDFMALLSIEPNDPQVKVRVRQNSVRNRSHERRKADLDSALQLQAITQSEYRRAMSDDLDIPLTQEDRVYSRQAVRSAQRIIAGEEWRPVPLGDRTDFFLSAFRQAMFDRRARLDPEAMDRLSRALTSQMQMQAIEIQMQAQAQSGGAQPAAGAEQQPTEAQPEPGGSFTVADILAGSAPQAA